MAEEPRPQEEFQGTIERFAYRNGEWAVAHLLSKDGPLTVVGNIPASLLGQRVRVVGRVERHPRYGPQVQASFVEMLPPETREGVIAYLASGRFPGVGEKTARAIVAALGPDVLRVLEERPERIYEVPGIGERKAQAILDAVEAGRMERETLLFLYGLGLTSGVISRIVRRYGQEAPRIVRSDPYRLSREVHGIGFLTADRIARTMSGDPTAPSRVEAGVLHVLEEAALKEGHTCLPAEEAAKRAVRLLNRDFDEKPVTGGMVEEAIRRLVHERRLDEKGGTVALRPLARCEEVIAQEIRRILRTPLTPPPPRDPALVAAKAAREVGIAYAPEQARAVGEALTRPLLILTGGPGTGKTTTVRAILSALRQIGVREIALAAPSGRAAKRLSEATGHPAQTIHRLLGLRPSDEAETFLKASTVLEAEAVVVDEVSMCDAPLFLALVSALRSGKRLILVGDPEQLPSVGPGNVLKDLLAGGVPSVELSRNFRQGDGSTIVESAHAIRRGVVPNLDTPPKSQWMFQEAESGEDAQRIVLEMARQAMDAGLKAKDVQVLTPMHRGAAGVTALNERLQALWNPGGPVLLKVGDTRFCLGDRVICQKNDYERDVFNGDLGVVVGATHDEDDETELLVSFDGRTVRYPRGEAAEKLGLAYALTVHKAQGSEFPIVLVVLLWEQAVMLQRNLLYTAVTRAQHQCVVIGQRKAVGLAVRRKGAERTTRLAAYLKEDG